MASREIFVYADWKRLKNPTLMGIFRADHIRGNEVFSFEYDKAWLKTIVFNICVKNTDDHLRNHGFLLGEHGWTLSPAYDINPVPNGTGLTLNISDEDNSLSLELAKEVAEYFRIDSYKANDIIEHITKTISGWRNIAQKYGLSRMEQELMSAAFMTV